MGCPIVSSRQHPSLVSAAAIATTTLYRFVDQGIPGLDYTIDRTSNATFIVVYWDDLQQNGVPFIRIDASPGRAMS